MTEKLRRLEKQIERNHFQDCLKRERRIYERHGFSQERISNLSRIRSALYNLA